MWVLIMLTLNFGTKELIVFFCNLPENVQKVV